MLRKSPATTSEDAAALERLGGVVDEHPLAFDAMIRDATFESAALSPKAIVAND